MASLIIHLLQSTKASLTIMELKGSLQHWKKQQKTNSLLNYSTLESFVNIAPINTSIPMWAMKIF